MTTGKIQAVVQKADCISILKYQLVMCVILLLFSLDVRFGIFSWFRNKATRILG